MEQAVMTSDRPRSLGQPDRLNAKLDYIADKLQEIEERLARSMRAEDNAPESQLFFALSDQPMSHSNLRQDQPERTTRRALPDPRLIRRIVYQRQIRNRYFGDDLFGEPAWDMLLDLAAARSEYQRISVTSLCIASGVPPTTALRWIAMMVELGLLERVEDPEDGRRAFIQLSDKAADLLARYFAEIGTTAKFAS